MLVFLTFIMNFVNSISRNLVLCYRASNFRQDTISKNFCQKNLDVNTNITKDIILYKQDRDKFYRIINTFGICQFGFWSYLSLFAFKTLKNVPVNKDKQSVSWWQAINLGEPQYRYGITCVSFMVGFGMLAATWMLTLRSVKYLILRKGGNQVTLVTYTPFGRNRMFTLPLDNVSATQTRTDARSVLPLKIRGHSLHYMLDMKGEFKNTTLFDNTAGLKRIWTKK